MLTRLQAGIRLLAAALRDPAPILNVETIWDFMKLIEAYGQQLPDTAKADELYREHVSCYDRIYRRRTNTIAIGNDQLLIGDQLLIELAAYADQAASLLPLLLAHCEAPQQASFQQNMEGILARTVQEIEEIPGGPTVQQALAVFRQHSQDETVKKRSPAEALYYRALDLYDREEYEKCLVPLGQALRLTQEKAHIYYLRGDARCALGHYRGAAAEYLLALRAIPCFFAAAMNLGNAYACLGLRKKSLACFQHALRLEPESALAHYNVGCAFYALNRLPEALLAFNRAIELDSEYGGAYFNRGTTLSCLGRHEETLADYDRAMALEPEDSNIAWTVAWSHFDRVGLSGDDVEHLTRVSHLDPRHYTSLLCHGVIALQRLDIDAALARFKQAQSMEPTQWDPPFWVGMAAALKGDVEHALPSIEHSLELGLPPTLLAPLYWLQKVQPVFFRLHAQALLQRLGVRE